MLTAEHVRARRKGTTLRLSPLGKEDRERAEFFAEVYAEIARDHVGKTRGELEEALDEVPVDAREQKLAAGIRKLVLDACEIEDEEGERSPEIRRAVFLRAASARAASADPEAFSRAEILAEVAAAEGLSQAQVETALYADLRQAHRVKSVRVMAPQFLVDGYEFAQAQAVLLRAVRIEIVVRMANAPAARALFRRIKFLRLIAAIQKDADGAYRIVVDGPFSLFQQTTKYGLAFAQLLPVLEACERYSLVAEIRWGELRTPLEFRWEGGGGTEAQREEPTLSDDLATFSEKFARLESGWEVRPAAALLEAPGLGLVIPDLEFRRSADGARVYLESLGYFRKESVWKRADLARRGLGEKVLFALSERLRVDESVIGDDVPAALYVYKGVMNARAVLEKVDALASRSGTEPA